ncbi:MAG: spore germination protein [Clostridiales bacterium]|nr:spore germination protein [Clostridiales bacterium]
MSIKQVFNSFSNVFKFDDSDRRFELYETEYGDPYEKERGERSTQLESNVKEDLPINKDLHSNLTMIRQDFRTDINPDLLIREFMLGGEVPAAIVFINGISNAMVINDFLLRDGMKEGAIKNATKPLYEYVLKSVFTVCDAKTENKFVKLKRKILAGQAIIFIEGEERALVFDSRLYPTRSVDVSENEKTVLGPKEAFVESLRTNVSMIRKSIQTDNLVCEMRTAGKESNTKIGILYCEGVANNALVNEVKRRLSKINIKKVFAISTLIQMMESTPNSPFTSALLTEKPDRCASFLLEGHVALVCDGSPLIAIVPTTLYMMFSMPEDFYARSPAASFVRAVRIIAAITSIYLPGLFIAIVMYHHGFLSPELLNTIIASRVMVFVPISVELVMLMLVFQLIREAGMRVPGSIGQALGIIGGLVLGQAAVAANLASAVVLILVAFVGLGNFCIPDYTLQLTSFYIRIGFVFAAIMAGFLGIVAGTLIVTGYMC